MLTKTSSKAVHVRMRVNELIEDQKIEVVTLYHEGDIVTTYDFMVENEGTTVVYSENNHFEKGRNELNYNIVSFFYQWLYKRQVKKRMQYIEASISEVMG